MLFNLFPSPSIEKLNVEKQMTHFIAIDSLGQIKTYLTDPANCLVIFDVDYVLLHPIEPAFQFPNFVKNLDFIRKVFNELTPLQRDIFANLMVFDQLGSALVENQAPHIIGQIQKLNYKTIALTATLTGKMCKKSLPQERIRILKSNGIDFSQSFPNASPLSFKELSNNGNSFPSYLKGVLFSNGENQKNQKAETLNAFLEYVHYLPSHIILIDDRLPNLEKVSELAAQNNIKFTGLHYQGALKYSSKVINNLEFEEKWKELAQKAIDESLHFDSSIKTAN